MELCRVKTFDHLQAYVFGFFQQAYEIAIDWKPLKEGTFNVGSKLLLDLYIQMEVL